MRLSKRIFSWLWNGPDLKYDKKKPDKRLGDFLVEMGAVAPADLDAAIHAQKMGSKKQIGLLLMDQGVLKLNDLVKALKAQRKFRSP